MVQAGHRVSVFQLWRFDFAIWSCYNSEYNMAYAEGLQSDWKVGEVEMNCAILFKVRQPIASVNLERNQMKRQQVM
jgi:hypothetical protein